MSQGVRREVLRPASVCEGCYQRVLATGLAELFWVEANDPHRPTSSSTPIEVFWGWVRAWHNLHHGEQRW